MCFVAVARVSRTVHVLRFAHGPRPLQLVKLTSLPDSGVFLSQLGSQPSRSYAVSLDPFLQIIVISSLVALAQSWWLHVNGKSSHHGMITALVKSQTFWKDAYAESSQEHHERESESESDGITGASCAALPGKGTCDRVRWGGQLPPGLFTRESSKFLKIATIDVLACSPRQRYLRPDTLGRAAISR